MTLEAILVALQTWEGPALALLDEVLHALMAAKAPGATEQEQVAAARAVSEAAVDALEKAES